MANYNSTYTGQEVDNAVGRALPDGTIDVDIRSKQDKLNQAQINAVNSGINATKVAKYDGYEQEIDNKQDNLPDIVNDRYLHTNALTGELEWKVGVSKGTDDYNDLTNKPTINGEEIVGDVSLEDLNVQEQLTQEQLDAVNSEVTSEWKNTIDGDITSLEVGKQDKLSQDQLNKINRALVSPLATENTKRIVMVDEQNNQVQLRVGDGLTINGLTSPFTLEAQGGSGGVSDVKIDNTSIVSGGVADIPIAKQGVLGSIKASSYYGFGISIGGEPYASDMSYSTYQSKVNNTFISKGTLENVLNARSVGGGWTLLWENASPHSQFTRQILVLDTTGYSKIAVIGTYGGAYIFTKDSIEPAAGSYSAMQYYSLEDTDGVDIYRRKIEVVLNSRMTFDDNYHTFIETIDGVVGVRRVTANTINVPYKIYGFN